MLAVDAVDFPALPGRKRLFRIESPRAFEQSLAPQHFMAARNAACEVMRDVEESAVAVRNPRVEGEQLGVDPARGERLVNPLVQRDGLLRPDAPVPEQSAPDAHL